MNTIHHHSKPHSLLNARIREDERDDGRVVVLASTPERPVVKGRGIDGREGEEELDHSETPQLYHLDKHVIIYITLVHAGIREERLDDIGVSVLDRYPECFVVFSTRIDLWPVEEQLDHVEVTVSCCSPNRLIPTSSDIHTRIVHEKTDHMSVSSFSCRANGIVVVVSRINTEIAQQQRDHILMSVVGTPPDGRVGFDGGICPWVGEEDVQDTCMAVPSRFEDCLVCLGRGIDSSIGNKMLDNLDKTKSSGKAERKVGVVGRVAIVAGECNPSGSSPLVADTGGYPSLGAELSHIVGVGVV